jgi:hypothetical protein
LSSSSVVDNLDLSLNLLSLDLPATDAELEAKVKEQEFEIMKHKEFIKQLKMTLESLLNDRERDRIN